jgi:hypothetical protein
VPAPRWQRLGGLTNRKMMRTCSEIYALSGSCRFSSRHADALQKDQLFLHADDLPQWFPDKLKVISTPDKKPPAGGNFVRLDQAVLGHEVVKIGNFVAQKAVEFSTVQNTALGDSDIAQEFLITGVVMLPQAIAIELGEERFAVREMRQMNVQQSFQTLPSRFESFEPLAQKRTSLVVADQVAAHLLAFEDDRCLQHR